MNFTREPTTHNLPRAQEAYIRIMNQCKAKKLLWRMNKSVARDMLPSEPLPVQVQPWHMCCVVSLSAYRTFISKQYHPVYLLRTGLPPLALIMPHTPRMATAHTEACLFLHLYWRGAQSSCTAPGSRVNHHLSVRDIAELSNIV